MPSYRCPAPGCPALSPAPGKCPRHRAEGRARTDARRNRSRTDPRRNTARWSRLSRQVCSEEPLCPGVGDPCGRLTTETHHLVEPEEGGDFWSRDNLQALCHSCHSRETATRNAARGVRPERD